MYKSIGFNFKKVIEKQKAPQHDTEHPRKGLALKGLFWTTLPLQMPLLLKLEQL